VEVPEHVQHFGQAVRDVDHVRLLDHVRPQVDVLLPELLADCNHVF